MTNFGCLTGRFFLSLIFILSGVMKIPGFAGTKEMMIQNGMTFATDIFLIGAILLEVGGGLSVLLGWRARWGAIALAVFLVPATLIFHTDFSGPMGQMQQIMMMKNIAILGGCLVVAANGPGGWSLDRKAGRA